MIFEKSPPKIDSFRPDSTTKVLVFALIAINLIASSKVTEMLQFKGKYMFPRNDFHYTVPQIPLALAQTVY